MWHGHWEKFLSAWLIVWGSVISLYTHGFNLLQWAQRVSSNHIMRMDGILLQSQKTLGEYDDEEILPAQETPGVPSIGLLKFAHLDDRGWNWVWFIPGCGIHAVENELGLTEFKAKKSSTINKDSIICIVDARELTNRPAIVAFINSFIPLWIQFHCRMFIQNDLARGWSKLSLRSTE